MKLEERIRMRGRLHIRLFGPDGALKEERRIDNLVVTAGKGFMASRMKDASATAMSHIGVGTGATAAAVGDTALGAELTRVALDSTNVSANVITYAATFPAGVGTGAVTEAGILNAASVGTLLARTVFATLNKGAADYLVISWAITIG